MMETSVCGRSGQERLILAHLDWLSPLEVALRGGPMEDYGCQTGEQARRLRWATFESSPSCWHFSTGRPRKKAKERYSQGAAEYLQGAGQGGLLKGAISSAATPPSLAAKRLRAARIAGQLSMRSCKLRAGSLTRSPAIGSRLRLSNFKCPGGG